MDYTNLRKAMVESQLVARDITDEKVIRAFNLVERDKFVPDEFKKNSYEDHPLPIGDNQTISQPYIVALMVQLLKLEGNEKVLEVGTGSGYETAILCQIVKDVFTVECIDALSRNAQKILNETGYKNIHFKIGDGTQGWPQEAPFDRIIVSAASSKVPEPLLDQLNDPGRLVIPVGDRFNQNLIVINKEDGRLQTSNICGCSFVPLVGKYS